MKYAGKRSDGRESQRRLLVDGSGVLGDEKPVRRGVYVCVYVSMFDENVSAVTDVMMIFSQILFFLQDCF